MVPPLCTWATRILFFKKICTEGGDYHIFVFINLFTLPVNLAALFCNSWGGQRKVLPLERRYEKGYTKLREDEWAEKVEYEQLLWVEVLLIHGPFPPSFRAGFP